MHLVTIIWALICAMVIVAYPLYVFNKIKKVSPTNKESDITPLSYDYILELISLDLRNTSTGWSFTIDIPQMSEENLKHPILFYLETDETCLKLPLNNATLGYTAEVFKNVGKVYLTFKCLKDGVSNYHIPKCHLKKLKVLVLKPKRSNGKQESNFVKTTLSQLLKENKVNLNNYDDTLIYLSNIADFDFKGHKCPVIKLTDQQTLSSAV